MLSRYYKRSLVFFSLALILLLAGCFKEASTQQTGTTRVFSLYAADMQQNLGSGKTLYSWGYGLWDEKTGKPASPPTLPGPEIRVTEGDHVKITFHNEQLEPHTIHFHGVDNAFAGDGTPGISQEEVKTGKSFVYEFDAKKAGTYFYHCHVEPDRHPEMGLYGAFIVEPKKKPHYDGETVMMLGERDPMLSVAEGTEEGKEVGTAAEGLKPDEDYDTINRHPTYFTINGKTDPDIPPLRVKEGGRYLIRLINAGNDVHSIHIHGHHFQVVAADSRELKDPMVKDTIEISPGERYDIVLTADNPGVWPIHCHIGPHGVHGMHMLMVYDGFKVPSMDHQSGTEKMDFKSGSDAMLKQLDTVNKALADKNEAKIKESTESLWDTWTGIEDSVKAHDKTLYNKIEEALGPLVAAGKSGKASQQPEVLSAFIAPLQELLKKMAEM